MFLAGLGLARIVEPIDGWLVAGSGVVNLIGFLISRRRVWLLVGMSVTLGLLGLWRGGVMMNRVGIYDHLIGQKVTIEITALDDAVYSDRGQLEFPAGSMVLIEQFGENLPGEIDVEGMGLPMVYRGDRLSMTGRLFKKRGGQIVGTSFANLRLLSRHQTIIESARRAFAAGMQDVLPDQVASFGLGLLIGQRATLDPQLEQDMITTGLVHIVAVSGYNLTVIIEIVRRMFRRRSRFQSVVFALSLIGVFLLFTGFAPSIVRAAAVSSLSLLMWFFGRSFKPLFLLLLTAALTAGVNPLYIWSNIGWYLSFTAFFGVLVLAPLIKERFVPARWQDSLIPSVLTETTAAQLCTLPVILFIFGRLSLISIIANLLVVPLSPLAMLLSFLSGLAGSFDFLFARLITAPTYVVLEYMLSISSILAKIPHASIDFKINTGQMVVLNLMIIGLVLILKMKLRPNHAIITEKKEQI